MRVRSSTSCAGPVRPAEWFWKLPRTRSEQPSPAAAQHKIKRRPLRETTGDLLQPYVLSSQTIDSRAPAEFQEPLPDARNQRSRAALERIRGKFRRYSA